MQVYPSAGEKDIYLEDKQNEGQHATPAVQRVHVGNLSSRMEVKNSH